jgi:hypothetical protein
VIDAKPLIPLKEGGLRIGGYWQGLWVFVDGRAGFVDGGGTRLQLPSGLAFGVTGGVLRQRIEKSGSALAVMLAGVTIEWDRRLTSWFTLTPRVTTGLAMYGWQAPDGTMDGGPHFMIRPELSAYVGILPFMEVGGGLGYQVVTGEADTPRSPWIGCPRSPSASRLAWVSGDVDGQSSIVGLSDQLRAAGLLVLNHFWDSRGRL